jgi:hypothetical protein
MIGIERFTSDEVLDEREGPDTAIRMFNELAWDDPVSSVEELRRLGAERVRSLRVGGQRPDVRG